MRPRVLLTLALLVGAGVLVAACGGPSGTGERRPADEQVSASPPLSALPPPTLAAPTAPPSQPTDAITTVTVSGRVAAGTAQGCLVLDAGPVTWVLVGPPTKELVPGRRIEVVGRPAPELVTPCDGTVLLVRAVRSL